MAAVAYHSMNSYLAIAKSCFHRAASTVYLFSFVVLVTVFFPVLSGRAVEADSPYMWQKHFQDGATEILLNTQDFYDDLAAVMVFIALLVFWLVVRLILNFSSGLNRKNAPLVEFRHHTRLEIW